MPPPHDGDERREPALLLAPLLLAVTLLLAALLFWPMRALVFTGANDFLSFYAGGRLAFSGELYHPDAVQRVQRDAAGTSSRTLSFIRPPFYAAALAPLARLPYTSAYRVWQLLQLGCIVCLLCTLPAAIRTKWTLALCASIPLAWSFANGQDLPLLLLLLASSWRLAAAGRYGPAGVVLSLCLIKPHLVALLPFAFLPHRRRAGFFAFLGGAAALGITSFWTAGPGWLAEYFHVLWNAEIHGGLAHSPTWHGAARGLLNAPWAGWALCAATLAAAAIPTLKAAWDRAASAALAATALCVPHLFVQDFAILLPALLGDSKDEPPWGRAARLALLMPLPYLLELAIPFPAGLAIVALETALLAALVYVSRREKPQIHPKAGG